MIDVIKRDVVNIELDVLNNNINVWNIDVENMDVVNIDVVNIDLVNKTKMWYLMALG